jgi:glycosyltransferase involved in cell wall biosynthesis
MFTDGFRPDIIVARDPFESALAAYLISERFDRPLQIHVLDDVAFNEKQFIEAAKENGWRLRFMHFVLRRAESVRTSTDAIKSMLQKRYKHIEDIALIPRFFNTRALLALPRSTTEDMFPQFSFTVLYIGDLSPESTLFRALDTVRVLLSTPTIGFVVIGEGSQKQHYKERAALLGIEKQVLFLGAVSDTTAHIRSADVLLVTDTTTESEDLIIRAAALGTPLIMAETPIRKDLFTDGESAFLCPPEEGMAFAEKMRLFINANALRTQFSQNGRSVVQNRIEDSPERFTVAFRDTIEQVLFNVEVSGTISPQSEPTLGTVSAASPAPTTVIDGVEMKLPEEAKE